MDGLRDRRRDRAPKNRIPESTIAKVLDLYRKEHAGFSVEHFWEQLEEHDIHVSYSWTKALLHDAGLCRRGAKRKRYRRRREREAMPGLMLHLDASEHRWFEREEGGMQDLIAFVDDATGELLAPLFVPEESTRSVLVVLREIIEEHGRFARLYTERASHFVHTPKAGEGPGFAECQQHTQRRTHGSASCCTLVAMGAGPHAAKRPPFPSVLWRVVRHATGPLFLAIFGPFPCFVIGIPLALYGLGRAYLRVTRMDGGWLRTLVIGASGLPIVVLPWFGLVVAFSMDDRPPWKDPLELIVVASLLLLTSLLAAPLLTVPFALAVSYPERWRKEPRPLLEAIRSGGVATLRRSLPKTLAASAGLSVASIVPAILAPLPFEHRFSPVLAYGVFGLVILFSYVVNLGVARFLWTRDPIPELDAGPPPPRDTAANARAALLRSLAFSLVPMGLFFLPVVVAFFPRIHDRWRLNPITLGVTELSVALASGLLLAFVTLVALRLRASFSLTGPTLRARDERARISGTFDGRARVLRSALHLAEPGELDVPHVGRWVVPAGHHPFVGVRPQTALLEDECCLTVIAALPPANSGLFRGESLVLPQRLLFVLGDPEEAYGALVTSTGAWSALIALALTPIGLVLGVVIALSL